MLKHDFLNALNEIRELHRYRELLRNLVTRDVKKRYKRSVLGFLWVMLDPLLMMFVFYFVFSGLFGNKVGNYTAYVITGITMWQLFAQGTQVSSMAFINNRSILNKLYMPKSIFPLSVVVSSLIHFIFAMVPLFIVILFSGTDLSNNILFIPFVVFLIFLFALGISLSIATLAVFFHDVVYIYDVILLAWMYLSAIFYPLSIMPEKFQSLMFINPVFHYISLFRAALYDDTISMTGHFIYGTVFAVLSLLFGWIIYYKNRDKIIFYL